jgi:hypothetical protein
MSFSGKLRGYNVYAGAAGGNCVDLEHTDNSYRFFGLVALARQIGLMLGQTGYAPPTFANAASIGVPLTLNPNELGIGLSTDTEGAPQGNGLKLRVECSTSTTGDVKIVALAGASGNETMIADGIGNGTVSACHL